MPKRKKQGRKKDKGRIIAEIVKRHGVDFPVEAIMAMAGTSRSHTHTVLKYIGQGHADAIASGDVKVSDLRLASRGLGVRPRARKKWSDKLTRTRVKMVNEIVRRHESKTFDAALIAKKYGCSKSHVDRMRVGATTGLVRDLLEEGYPLDVANAIHNMSKEDIKEKFPDWKSSPAVSFRVTMGDGVDETDEAHRTDARSTDNEVALLMDQVSTLTKRMAVLEDDNERLKEDNKRLGARLEHLSGEGGVIDNIFGIINGNLHSIRASDARIAALEVDQNEIADRTIKSILERVTNFRDIKDDWWELRKQGGGHNA